MKNSLSRRRGVEKANKIKKTALFAALAFLFSTQIWAQGGTTGPLTWNLEDGVLTISGEGEMPDYQNGDGIPWLPYRESIETIVIESGVTTIGDFAFIRCRNLTSVTIPDGVTKIGRYAFHDCTWLTSIHLPNSITSIGESAFFFCPRLTSIIIPDGVERIEKQTFLTCFDLASVTLPNSVTYIDSGAFQHCQLLTSITIPENVTYIGSEAFHDCASLPSIDIPDGVTTIEESVFDNCVALTSCTLPDGVTSIGKCAFRGCPNLISFSIPNSVTNIGEAAFSGCKSLTSIFIPNNVTNIGINAFTRCFSLPSIDVAPDNNDYCAEEGVLFNKDKTVLVAYPGGKTGEYAIPNSVVSINKCAFAYCFRLPFVTIPNSVKKIDSHAFRGCEGLTSITIPNNITSIEDYTFEDCVNLASVSISNNAVSIGMRAFAYCKSLTSIIIPNSVTTIGNEAFVACENLTSVLVPNSVTNIGDWAFSSCSSLTSFTVLNLNPDNIALGHRVFSGVTTRNCTLLVPNSAVADYKGSPGWYAFNVVGGGYLVVGKSDNVQGTVDGSGLYEYEEKATLAAAARSNYQFENWSIDGVVISTENPYTFTVTSDVEITANFKSDGTSLDEMDDLTDGIVVFPNPAHDVVMISAPDNAIYSAELYNLSGQKLGAYHQTAIDISHLPAGIYFIKIATESGSAMRKVVKK